MKETVTIKIEKSIGYSGKSAGKSYIAKITGTDKQYIWQREFIDTECTDRDEMFKARRKRKGSWTEAAAVEPGLYERQNCGERSYLIVWVKDTAATFCKITEDRAAKMALLMDDGQTFEESREATKAPKTTDPAILTE